MSASANGMHASASGMRELIALAGPVRCERCAGAVNLVLRGQAGAPPDVNAGLTEVLFSDAAEVTLPDELHDIRVFELLDAPASASADAAAAANAGAGAARQFRLQGPHWSLALQARTVQLQRDAAAAFYGAVPPLRVPLRVRLGWSLLLAALRLPGAVALIRTLRGSR